MKTTRNIRIRESSPSFALISVLALVSLAALTATAFLASARLERQASSSIEKATLLEMALNSGKFCVTQLINDYSQADLGNVAITTYWRTNWTDELGYPFIAKIKTSGANNGSNSAMWYYLPLFSPAGLKSLGTNDIQNAMRFTNTHQGTFSNDMRTYMSTNATNGFVDNPGLNHPKCVQIPLLGGRTSPPVGWVYIEQEKRKFGSNLTNTSPAVRIAWFTEDLEGLIDAERMGAATSRSTGTNPEEVSVSSATGTNGTLVSSISTFTNNRAAYISFGLLATNSGLANLTNARYFASGLRAWSPTTPSASDGALAWIPVGIPISGSSNAPKGYTSQGYTKFNLNNLATNSGSAAQAVTNIAQIITSNLSTNFLRRAGGLTDSILYSTNDFDYAKCLAANIVDYIDADSYPTALDAAQGYCGIESLPYLTEIGMRIRLEYSPNATASDYTEYNDKTNTVTATALGPVRILPSFNVYLEFWNPYSVPITFSNFSSILGIKLKSYGTNDPTSTNAFALGYNGYVQTVDSLADGFKSGASGPLTNMTFSFATASSANLAGMTTNNPTLNPNQYCSIRCQNNNINWATNISSTSTNKWLFTNNGYFFKYNNTSTNRVVWLNQNTAAFSNDCIVNNITSTNDPGTSWLCEISVSNTNSASNIPYIRVRNMRFDSVTMNATNSASKSATWWLIRPSSRIYVGATNGFFAQTPGDPRISYFLRNTGGELHGNVSWSNTASGGGNSFGGPNQDFDISQWPDRGHPPKQYGNLNANEPSAANISMADTGTDRAPSFIRNGKMTNILELGNIYDPILWRGLTNGNVTSDSISDSRVGGGNSLRIGRPEHTLFAFTNMYNNSTPWIPNMAQSAAALLDLFCLTNGVSTTNSGPYSLGGGKINLNTAPAPVLRALAGGVLMTNDPVLINNLSQVAANHSVPAGMSEAFAQGVMRFRSKYPFLTPSHLCFIGTDPTWPNTSTWPSNSVFGNTNTISLSAAPGNSAASTRINVNEWSDQAAEEWFSKIYALSSCQSQNFRIYVVAQRVATNSSGQTNAIGPLVKKYYQVYFQNGSAVGTITPNSTYPNNSIYSWPPTGACVDIYKSDY